MNIRAATAVSCVLITAVILSLCGAVQISADTGSFEGVSPEVMESVTRIKTVNMVMGEAVGYAGERPEQFDNFEKLVEVATPDELRALTDHPNGTVRCYAFWALSRVDSVNLVPILKSHLDDYEEVTTQFGCTIMDEMAGDFMLTLVTFGCPDPYRPCLDSLQAWQIDSMLIYGEYRLLTRDFAIERASPNEYLYPKIRELVAIEHNTSALIPLARYQKPEDVELILASCPPKNSKLCNCAATFRAISHFPRDEFFPMLESAFKQAVRLGSNQHCWNALCRAIASFEDNKAARLLASALTANGTSFERQDYLSAVFWSISNHAPVFDSLLWRLWLEEKITSPGALEYLRSRNPVQLYQSVTKALRNPEDLYALQDELGLPDIELSRKTVEAMVSMVMDQDSFLATELIIHNIASADVHQFPVFADAAGKSSDTLFVQPLLNRLADDSNPHVYLKAAEALISYGDDEITRRVASARRLNPSISMGWGSERFDALLREAAVKK